MSNPFTLSFGLEPTSYIARHQQTDEIIRSFSSDPSPSHIYMITGIRGSGKTVLLSELEDHFRDDGWIVYNLSIEADLLRSFAAKLYNDEKLQSLFAGAKINLSFLGLGIEIQGAPPITDLGTAIERMLAIVQKQGKKVLIAIDEAVNSASMRQFASEFQILLRNRYPVYLLMTGLYENLYELQNEKTLTFLYRAPKIMLAPLNVTAVTESYQSIFHNSIQDARRMAALANGYSYAYQVVGYLCWDMQVTTVTDEVISRFDTYMDEYVYGKIWDEQSPVKRTVLTAMADTPSGQVTEIREKIHMSPQEFSVYRSRLIRQGLIQAGGYGKIMFTLPRFGNFIQNQTYGLDM
ncbi:MAG: ATP-binding protein [Chordicoccus sp.]